jgi:hypothetical protein
MFWKGVEGGYVNWKPFAAMLEYVAGMLHSY